MQIVGMEAGREVLTLITFAAKHHSVMIALFPCQTCGETRIGKHWHVKDGLAAMHRERRKLVKDGLEVHINYPT